MDGRLGSPLQLRPRKERGPRRFEIRIVGHLDEIAAAAFTYLDVTHHGSDTLVSGELDQAALHGVLERIRALCLDLVEVRRVRGPALPDRDRPSSTVAAG